MNKTFLSVFSIVTSIFLLTFPPFAFAHFPQTDGNMTVVLHVDPDDDPTAGKKANLYFLFDDTTKQFNIEKCSCTVSIAENGKQIFKQNLVEKKYDKPSIWGTNMPYVFPNDDVYHIVLTGKPKTANVFEQFTLSWYFRVDPGDSGIVTQEPSDIPIILGIVFCGTIFLVLFGIFIKKGIINAEENIDKPKKV